MKYGCDSITAGVAIVLQDLRAFKSAAGLYALQDTWASCDAALMHSRMASTAGLSAIQLRAQKAPLPGLTVARPHRAMTVVAVRPARMRMLEPHHQSSPTCSSSHSGQNAWSRPTSCAQEARQLGLKSSIANTRPPCMLVHTGLCIAVNLVYKHRCQSP